MMLNLLKRTCHVRLRMESIDFPKHHNGESTHPLPEDYAMRGVKFAERFFPKDWLGLLHVVAQLDPSRLIQFSAERRRGEVYL